MCVCVCVCVCVLWTGASRRLTEGTSGLSGTFFTKRFVRKLEALFAYPGPSQLESAILFTLQCFVYSPFHVCRASVITVQHKRTRYEAIACAHTYMHRS